MNRKWWVFFQKRHATFIPKTWIEHITARRYIHVVMMAPFPRYDAWAKLEWSQMTGVNWEIVPEAYVDRYIVQCYHGHMDCLEMPQRVQPRRQIFWFDYVTCVHWLKHAFNLPWWVFNCDTAYSALRKRGAQRKFRCINEEGRSDG